MALPVVPAVSFSPQQCEKFAPLLEEAARLGKALTFSEHGAIVLVAQREASGGLEHALMAVQTDGTVELQR